MGVICRYYFVSILTIQFVCTSIFFPLFVVYHSVRGTKKGRARPWHVTHPAEECPFCVENIMPKNSPKNALSLRRKEGPGLIFGERRATKNKTAAILGCAAKCVLGTSVVLKNISTPRNSVIIPMLFSPGRCVRRRGGGAGALWRRGKC